MSITVNHYDEIFIAVDKAHHYYTTHCNIISCEKRWWAWPPQKLAKLVQLGWVTEKQFFLKGPHDKSSVHLRIGHNAASVCSYANQNQLSI